jgi:hypothetical protein
VDDRCWPRAARQYIATKRPAVILANFAADGYLDVNLISVLGQFQSTRIPKGCPLPVVQSVAVNAENSDRDNQMPTLTSLNQLLHQLRANKKNKQPDRKKLQLIK